MNRKTPFVIVATCALFISAPAVSALQQPQQKREPAMGAKPAPRYEGGGTDQLHRPIPERKKALDEAMKEDTPPPPKQETPAPKQEPATTTEK